MSKGPTTDKTGQIVKAPPDPGQHLAVLIQRLAPEIARALPKHVTPERMARIALTAVRMNQDLARCTEYSFLGCLLSAAQLGLETNTPTGQAYLIPRKGQCTLIVGYKGMMELAERSGRASVDPAEVVRAGDEFAYQLGTDRWIRHKPSEDEDRENRPITHVYATATVNGRPRFVVLTKAEIDKRRKRSPASNSGPWVTDYEAMAKKTAVRALCTWLPQSPEVARAIALDEAPELGNSQSLSYDPAITDALKSGGLIEEHHDERPSKPEIEAKAEVVNADGEVSDFTPAKGREPGEEG